jgi:cytochrome oxidase Cu insertion factor (SCO1/SenC/PrrC family)
MSHLPLAFGRLRRCLRAAVLPFCVGLLLAALTAAPLHAQAPTRLKAPDFDGAVGPTLGSDKPIKLKDLRGKIVIVEFWTLC